MVGLGRGRPRPHPGAPFLRRALHFRLVDDSTPDAALRSAATRLGHLVRSVSDPQARVPGLQWTIAETAAHVVCELRDYVGFAAGRSAAPTVDGARSPSERAAIVNAEQLRTYPERDPAVLAAALSPAVDAFLAAASARPADEHTTVSNGLPMTAATMTAALLGEQLLHGWDIARAARKPWTIPRGEALHVIAGVLSMVPDYLDRERARGRHIGYELRMRGGPRYRVAIDDGAARVTAAGERVDCVISANPVAFLLVGYGRVSQVGQVLRGRIVAGGRKPWLGLAFGQLITGP
jgi:uncharacterized protein (TIGR03083 family)